MADTIVVLREGAVEQVGTPIELYARPCNQFVACFLGTPQMNLLKAQTKTVTGKGMSLSVDGGRSAINATVDGTRDSAGADCIVGIRPEHLALSDNGAIAGTVIASEMLGSENPERLADGLSRRGVLVDWRPGVVRISPHFFNTDEEVAQTLEILAQLLG